MAADFEAFKADLVALLPRLSRFARTLAASADEGNELVQMACERAIQRYRDWTPGTRLDSWMFTMTRNLWIGEIRKRRVRTGSGTVAAETQTEVRTPADAEGRVLLASVFEAVQGLPEGQRMSLLLVAAEGYSYQEAAEILDLPLGTVASQVARARLALSRRFNESERGLPPASPAGSE